MGFDGLQGGQTFDHLETVGGHQKRLGRRVIAVIGPADALHEAFDVLGCADLDHQIHIAPVDPQIKAAGADDGAQLSGHHRRLDPCALFAVKAAVMDADGQRVLIGEPEVVKEDLGLRAGVVENERGVVGLDLRQHGGDRIGGPSAGPWGRLVGGQHGDIGVWPRIGGQDRAGVGMARQKTRDGGGVIHGGRQAHAAQIGAEGLQAGQRQHQLITALGVGQCVDFIDHHALEAREDAGGVLVGGQQGKAFRRGQQDMRRVGALAAFGMGGGVAGAVLDPDGQAHLGHGGLQVALDIGGQRLERRDIEGVQARVVRGGEVGQRGQKPCQRLAAACGGDQEERRIMAARQHVKLMRMRRPALGLEPVGEDGGQGGAHAGLGRAGVAARLGGEERRRWEWCASRHGSAPFACDQARGARKREARMNKTG